MKIIIKTTGSVELTSDLRSYVEEKAAMLSKYLGSKDDDAALCMVEVGRVQEGQHSGNIYRAEFNITYAGGQSYYAATAPTLQKAIDKAKDEMKRELRRAHSKEKHLFKRGAHAVKNFLRGGGE